MNETQYELILCIVNMGFADTVMSAAKEVGARGGTVLNARGTANKEAEEFFHITIQPEKEIVMILVPAELRDGVLHAVYQAAGLKTAGQGISFALPVTHAVGLTTAADAQARAKTAAPEQAATADAAKDEPADAAPETATDDTKQETPTDAQ